MIYIETHSTSAYFNFAAEYYFMTEKPLDDTAFMFWRTQPTLMVGRFQNTYSEINLDYAKKQNIQLVRRLSGGGTIYTDMGGWQFTFITKGSNGHIEFSRFIKPVVAALREIGADVSFNGRNDLVVDGKKFSGNAQYIKAGNTLHHGSILFETNIEEMVRSTTVDEHKIISKGIKSVRERVTNLVQHLPAPMGMEDFKRVMIDGVMRENPQVYTLTPADIARITEIEAQQFNNWEKIYGASPKCSLQRKKHFPGGTVQCHLDVDKGIIRAAEIYGDFFGDIDIDALCQRLIGCAYRRESILACITDSQALGTAYGITADDFADALI